MIVIARALMPILGIVLVAAGYYGLTTIPFYLDDFSSILHNPAIAPPIDWQALWDKHSSRPLTYAIFALQLTWFGENAAAFHVFSILLHGLTSGLLGLLCWQLLRHQATSNTFDGAAAYTFSVGAAVLFAVHPQNSQAVVYAVQQGALWAAFGSLGALNSYVYWRTTQRMWALLVGLLFFIIALSGKQNAAVLPLMIWVLEWLFFKRFTKILFVSGIALLMVCVIGLVSQFGNQTLSVLDGLTRETADIARIDYLMTQLDALRHYQFQFFSLQGLRLEYDWPLITVPDTATVISAIWHSVVVICAILMRRKMPLLTLGVLCYYLAHTVESSVMPIKDLVFEHRTYLPNAGMVLGVVALLIPLTRRKVWALPAYVACAVLLLLLTYQLHNRITLWADKTRFYANEVSLSKRSARATGEYATALSQNNQCPKAISYFSHAIALYNKQPDWQLGIQPEMLLNYIACLRELGIYQKADIYELDLLEQVKEPVRRSMILSNRGLFYLRNKDFERANQALSEGFQLNKSDYVLTVNLAITRVNLGDYKAGQALLKHALMLKPGDETATNLYNKLQQLTSTSQE
ncbi:tetratricopeptide repeat protein [Aestuariibacter halophilus]|uniref:Tetratricopeptide repeat protein n=1 Tax=Fluctibacter halophilus TaxID=226011 RepID=A0ABS8G2Q1_9ALTE|nr:tetratricopeptide repeat protein [Aestuariibacter halophilus]MCC2614815.1 tetratricopeptide repeat protein [Aestuariibacter halophilus]